MSMLSRVAERLYWMGRYLERTEDTARLCNAYNLLILDLPTDTKLSWDILLDTIQVENSFFERYTLLNERNVMKFLLADNDNPGSIAFSVSKGRENVRTTRDVLPRILWECINELFHYTNDQATASIARRQRCDFLESIISRNQEINGIIETTVSHDRTWIFIKLGQLLERVDMTSRVLDVGTAALFDIQDNPAAEHATLWANLLKSLSATSAYHRDVGPLIEPNDAINFVVKNQTFPRSFWFCMQTIASILPNLHKHEAPLQLAQGITSMLEPFNATRRSHKGLHTFNDKLQRQLGALHNEITNTWFAPDTP